MQWGYGNNGDEQVIPVIIIPVMLAGAEHATAWLSLSLDFKGGAGAPRCKGRRVSCIYNTRQKGKRNNLFILVILFSLWLEAKIIIENEIRLIVRPCRSMSWELQITLSELKWTRLCRFVGQTWFLETFQHCCCIFFVWFYLFIQEEFDWAHRLKKKKPASHLQSHLAAIHFPVCKY